MPAKIEIFALVLCAVCGTGARADSYLVDPADSVFDAPHLAGVIVGGGVTGFTDRTVRRATSPVGGSWSLRVAIGAEAPLPLELGYLGTATSVQSLFGPASTTLIGTTCESDLRLNVLPHGRVNPFTFIGVGWQRYVSDT